MEISSINYLAIGVGTVAAMMLGVLWYGPLFGKKWMKIIGVDIRNQEKNKKMHKSYLLIYIVQFSLTFFQVLVLAHLIADTTKASGVERALWIWSAFVIPTLAGAVMWTNETNKNKWERFFIQGGYQLSIFIIFGLLLHYWK